jgi:hypothetical protein
MMAKRSISTIFFSLLMLVFALPLAAQTDVFQITYGDTVSDGVPGAGAGNIETSGAQDAYEFEGSTGDDVIFDSLVGSSGQFWWLLTASDGSVLIDSFNLDRRIVLPQTGTYTWTVRGSNATTTGVYSFRLLLVPAPQEFAISVGDTVSDGVPGAGAGNLEAPGATDVYTFDAETGDEVIFDWLSGSNVLIGWRLEAPDGTVLFDTFLQDQQMVLPQTGMYTLTVRGNTVDDFGVYSFALLEGVLNSSPVAVDDVATTDEDVTVTIDVLANDTDADGDTLTVESVTQPSNGTVVNNGADVTYMPSANFNGTDSFTYTVSDGNGRNATAAVTITINPVNDDPVARDDAAATTQDTPVTIDVLANDSDVDGDLLVMNSISQPGSGSAAINPDNTVTYTPNPGLSGADSLTYTVSDDRGGLATATITITISASTIQEVPIDILPFIWLNIVNLNSRGTLPVAILSDASFDARFVNVDTVSLAGAPAVRPFPRWPKFVELDVNHDQRKDIIVYFNIQDLELDLSATAAVLSGETYSGVSFAGADRVIIVPSIGPSLFNPKDGQVLRTNWPHFRWLSMAINTCYQFQLHDAPFTANEQPVLREATVVIMAHYQPGFLTNGTYYWRVRVGGSCQIQPGPWSSVHSFTIQAR